MQVIKTPIYQAKQVRELETLAETKFNLTSLTLMQRAAKAALDYLLRRWSQAKKIAIFCGGGNNGGDGYTLAYLAKEKNMNVTVWQVGDQSKLSEAAKDGYEKCKQSGVDIEVFNADANIGTPDLMIDAVCGIGLASDLRGEAESFVKKINKMHVPVFALDMPTGVNSDTGVVQGSALFATATITFIGLKLGLLTGKGVSYSGEVILNELQLPPEIFSNVEPVASKLHLSQYEHYLKPRLRDWHKGLSGHVLIVGGSPGYAGAPAMAGYAALRVGAGLVSIATHPDHAAMMDACNPELMCHGVNDEKDLKPLLEKADLVILGPGLGQTEWSKKVWKAAVNQNIPMLVDADALNLLAGAKMKKEDWVLTPHPGEAARLLGTSAETVQRDRLAAAHKIAQQYGGVAVLKGAGSLIVSADTLPVLCDKGNPGMATAGMGDVLSGVIGGFIAQGIPLSDAVKLGVMIHARAGDMAAKEGERGIVATDLMPFLRRLSNLAS